MLTSKEVGVQMKLYTDSSPDLVSAQELLTASFTRLLVALQHELYLQDNLAQVWMQQLDAFVLTERCYRSQQNCASVPDDK